MSGPLAPLATAHGELRRPAFLPDATRGVVKTVDADDIAGAGIGALMVNALHLGETPGVSVVRAAGGIHAFMGWDRPVASDSGGYQVFSLMAASPPLASVSERGFSYAVRKRAQRRLLSPRRSIEHQLRLGADIMFCLDHCTHPATPKDIQRTSVDHTLKWASECRVAFDAAVADRAPQQRPRLFAVVQGGENPDLRRRCVEGLVELGFDGFGFGGWPIDERGGLVDMVRTVAELVPAHAPKHALGIGRPENVVAASRAGYDLFDCTLPTRLGRRGLLYVLTGEPLEGHGPPDAFYTQLAIGLERYRRDLEPVEAGCDCRTCTRHSRSYLAHLFAINDPLGPRLATIHNLRFYARLVERLRDA